MLKLSKDGYVIVKSEHSASKIKECKDDLTVKPFVGNDFGNAVEKKFSVFLESPKKLYLPRFYGIQQFGNPTLNKISNPCEINVPFQGELRTEQKPIFNKVVDQLHSLGGGIISIKCGGGKTVLALSIIAKLSVKTIVVVHKDFLMTQWLDRIQQFLPSARIGKIQQNTVDVEDKDIVLAMVQSLSKKEYSKDVFQEFGLAVFDECHHLGAEVFSKSMQKSASKYMLGLSATPNRKDGLRKVFEWFIGPMAYSSKETNEDYVETIIHKYETKDESYNKEEMIYTKNGPKSCMPRMINNICSHKPRTDVILNYVKKYQKVGRDILILSDRREHLQYIHDNLQPIDSGFYVGGMKPQELRDSQTKQVILGTFSMASEGMDIPKLNTIILASPKSDIVQSVGRILRQKKESRLFHPLIIDINDSMNAFQNQSKKRLAYYSKCNYDISIIHTDGTKEVYVKQKKKKKIIVSDKCLID
jgi:superfamily II DNA or RNA helicase